MADNNQNNATEVDSYGSRGYANFVLMVLLVAYILSFIDRNILALLVGPIREQFGITDFQFSILHGWAFTLFYIFLGLPIGWLADRFSRKWIITGGVFFWSLATCLCGFAKSFMTLFLARVGVGVGEAALSPPTYSMLSDYYPPKQLRWATSVFTMGITLGSGISYIVGGWLYDYFAQMGGLQLGWLGHFEAWQVTFLTVGVPGFLLVIVLGLFVREPKRHVAKNAQASDSEAPSMTAIKAYVMRNWQAYTALAMGVSIMGIVGYGTLTWYAEFLLRTYGTPRSEGGSKMGLIFMFAGTAGAFAGAWFTGWLQRRGYKDANMRMVMLAALASLIPAVVGPLMGSSDHALLWAIPATFFHYTHFGVAMAALQLITINRMRAQVSALMLFVTNLFGIALGGSFIAFFTDFVFGDDLDLRYSLSVSSAICYLISAAIVGWGLKYYRAAMDQMEQAEQAGQA